MYHVLKKKKAVEQNLTLQRIQVGRVRTDDKDIKLKLNKKQDE